MPPPSEASEGTSTDVPTSTVVAPAYVFAAANVTLPPPLNARPPVPPTDLTMVTFFPFASIVPPFAPTVTDKLSLAGMNAALSAYARSVPPSMFSVPEPPAALRLTMILLHERTPPAMTFTTPFGARSPYRAMLTGSMIKTSPPSTLSVASAAPPTMMP